MKISVLTLFPEMFEPLNCGVTGRAYKNGTVRLEVVNIRDYSEDKHLKCDDTPFGGGAGMVMTPQPIYSALCAVDPERKARRIYLSPKGSIFDQTAAKRLADDYEHIVLLCGRYEGIDQRIIDNYIDEEISLGRFVLSGGEIAAMAVIDAVTRLCEGVINEQSLNEESFSDGDNLEYPQYTKPRVFMGHEVPEVLLSGDHQKIAAWRKQKSRELTEKNNPGGGREN